MGKQSQLLLKPTEVELDFQVGVEFENRHPQNPLLLPLNMLKTPLKPIEVPTKSIWHSLMPSYILNALQIPKTPKGKKSMGIQKLGRTE